MEWEEDGILIITGGQDGYLKWWNYQEMETVEINDFNKSYKINFSASNSCCRSNALNVIASIDFIFSMLKRESFKVPAKR